jgi:hypothetical protein
MREGTTADRVTALIDGVFAVIVTVMVFKAPDQPVFSVPWPLWPTAISGELLVYRDNLDQSPSPGAIRWSPNSGIDLDQLRSSVYGFVPAICDRVGCAHPVRIVSSGALRRAVCLCRLAYNVFEHQVLAHADAGRARRVCGV